MNDRLRTRQVLWTQRFMRTGLSIVHVDPGIRVARQLEIFRSNFKYTPSRCVFIFFQIRHLPMIPEGYEPKHLLWTLYFLLTYLTGRRLCHVLSADPKTLRKYIWTTIDAIASLAPNFVRIRNPIC